MKRICALMLSFATLATFVTLPNNLRACEACGRLFRSLQAKKQINPSAGFRRHPIFVTALGKLQYQPLSSFAPPYHPWYLRIGGHFYAVDFHGDKSLLKKAESLKSKSVSITGSLKTRWHYPPNVLIERPGRPLQRRKVVVYSIHVTKIEESKINNAKPAISMEMEGILRYGDSAKRITGADGDRIWIGPVLQIGRKIYRLEFKGGRPLSLKRMDGAQVLVRGRLVVREVPIGVDIPLFRAGALRTEVIFVVESLTLLRQKRA